MNGSGTITSRRQIVYTDDNGSSIAEVFDANNVKTNIVTINKDGAKSWNQILDPFIYQNETNTISSNDKNIINNSTSGYSVKYIYDKENHPISAEYKYINGSIENYTYTWN